MPAAEGLMPLSDGAAEVAAVGPDVVDFTPRDGVVGTYFPGFGAYGSTPEERCAAWSTFTQLADAGKITPLFDRSSRFDQAREALHYVRKKRPFGAVALEFSIK